MMRQIMKRAWEIYRTLEGDKIAKLSMALRHAWTEFKEGTIMNENIAKIVKQYNVRIHNDGEHLACDKRIAKNAADFEFMKNHKSEIMQYIKDAEAAKKAAAEERRRKIDAIEGLQEICDARADLSRWHDEFNRSFRDVGGMGVRQKPEYDFAAMYEKYPRAAAYLKAESYEYASHYVKSEAGKKAKERIINGDEPGTVIEEMEAEWKAYCDEHIWD